MSYRVGTTNYNLPQTEGTDKRDWSDTNQAFADIDAAIKTASDDSTLATSLAQTAQTAADGAVVDAAAAVTTANAASATASSASEAAALARTEAQSAVTTANSANTTAQAAQTTATNADTVALAAQSAVGDLTQLQTTDKSSAVAAINEVLSQIGGGSMPVLDFANPLVTFNATRTSYTASKECYVCGSIVGMSNSRTNLLIDNQEVFTVQGTGNGNYGEPTNYLPPLKVAAGSTITISGAISNLADLIGVYDVVS